MKSQFTRPHTRPTTTADGGPRVPAAPSTLAARSRAPAKIRSHASVARRLSTITSATKRGAGLQIEFARGGAAARSIPFCGSATRRRRRHTGCRAGSGCSRRTSCRRARSSRVNSKRRAPTRSSCSGTTASPRATRRASCASSRRAAPPRRSASGTQGALCGQRPPRSRSRRTTGQRSNRARRSSPSSAPCAGTASRGSPRCRPSAEPFFAPPPPSATCARPITAPSST